jgi:hypothetical protein
MATIKIVLDQRRAKNDETFPLALIKVKKRKRKRKMKINSLQKSTNKKSCLNVRL